MTLTALKALLEFDKGEFHAFQCERYKHNPSEHQAMSKAQDALLKFGFLELIGESFEITQKGRDLLESMSLLVDAGFIAAGASKMLD